MKTTTLKIFPLLGLIGILLSFEALGSFEIPVGWYKTGTKAESYDMGIDKGSGMDGKNAATIKSIDKTIDGYGTLMQSFKPDKFTGQRVRLSGYIKTNEVEGRAGFWFKIEQANSQNFISFDNMRNRAVGGTSDWKKYDLVLDVPSHASKISYGAYLRGTGQMWFDNLSFEVVDPSTPITGKKPEKLKVINEPANLDFEN
ncbi:MULTISPECIES: hypothetical protein [Flavobacterium]|uniref:hypothetical protein n=1 Tax=Flavobacterium TaxID=237 RepID=UPI001FCC8D6C|nr:MULTISPECIES: hypothetical protein [Flavobacterium]UOK43148.1 hypothetical protein LZF87_03265 [Flavobacterium enshiense]